MKHFAMNNQETFRTEISAEADERTMREIYLRGFEIAVKKAKPVSVMCSYNKVGAVWASENPYLLAEVLRDDWGYEGFVVSDWGAAHDIVKCVKAGLDLQMPSDLTSINKLMTAVENGEIMEAEIDRAASRMLEFLLMPKAEKRVYDRSRQHVLARELAAEGIVLLKNEDHALPLNQYKKLAVIGEFAENPLISGQGSAEVLVQPEYVDSPLAELRKALPDTEIKYMEMYKTDAYSHNMLWPQFSVLEVFVEDCEAVVFFAGSMVSEDTEFIDRRTAYMNENYEIFIRRAIEIGKKVIVVLQSGGALILGEWKNGTSSQDIRLSEVFCAKWKEPYTVRKQQEDMIG